MGIHCLWSILEPAGVPVPLEELRGMRVAIDASIWAYKVSSYTRIREDDPELGTATPSGLHVERFVRRILKLLYYGIRPIFVFDGAAPALKADVLRNRRAARDRTDDDITHAAQKLFLAQVARKAVKRVKSEIKQEVIQDTEKVAVREIEDASKKGEELMSIATLRSVASLRHQYNKAGYEISPAISEFGDTNNESSHCALSASMDYEDKESVLRSAYKTPNWNREDYYKKSLRNSEDPNSFSGIQLSSYIKKVQYCETLRESKEQEQDEYCRKNAPQDMGRGKEVCNEDEKGNLDWISRKTLGSVRSQAKTFYYLGPATSRASKTITRDPEIYSTNQLMNTENVPHTSDNNANITVSSCKTSLTKLHADLPLDLHSASEFLTQDITSEEARERKPSFTDSCEGTLSDCSSTTVVGEESVDKVILGSCVSTAEKETKSICSAGLADSPTKSLTISQSNVDALNEHDLKRAIPRNGEQRALLSKDLCSDSDDDSECYELIDQSENRVSGTMTAIDFLLETHDDKDNISLGDINKSKGEALSMNILDSDTMAMNQKLDTKSTKQESPSLPAIDVAVLSSSDKKFSAQPPDRLQLENILQEAEMRAKNEYEALKQENVSVPLHAQIRSILLDLRNLLVLFGIPYVESPSEADAQCAVLNSEGVVDAVVSDDSDVFLFGAKCVIRRFFDHSYVRPHVFHVDKIKRDLCLDRSDFLALGILLGGDYFEGVKGIGPSSAVRVLSAFCPSFITTNDCNASVDRACACLSRFWKFHVHTDKEGEKSVSFGRNMTSRSTENVEESLRSDEKDNIEHSLNQVSYGDAMAVLQDDVYKKTRSCMRDFFRFWMIFFKKHHGKAGESFAFSKDEMVASFPPVVVLNAYAKPNVHRNMRDFIWNPPDWESVNSCLREKCSDRYEILKTLLGKAAETYGRSFFIRTEDNTMNELKARTLLTHKRKTAINSLSTWWNKITTVLEKPLSSDIGPRDLTQEINIGSVLLKFADLPTLKPNNIGIHVSIRLHPEDENVSTELFRFWMKKRCKLCNREPKAISKRRVTSNKK